MTKNIEDMWEILANYNIFKIGKIKFNKKQRSISLQRFPFRSTHPKFDSYLSTLQYNDFEFNINRVMVLYEELININEAEFSFKHQVLCETILISLITSLDVYLVDTFIRLSWTTTIHDLDKIKVTKFIQKFNLENHFFRVFKRNKDLKFGLLEILAHTKYFNDFIRLNFQYRDNCKIAYRLFNINLPEIDHHLWIKIFSKRTKFKDPKLIYEDDSYMEIRHRIVHTGGKEVLYSKRMLDIEFIERALIDIVTFAYKLQCEARPKIIGIFNS